MKDIIYLDNSATTKPSANVIRVMSEAMEQDWYNPSSPYMHSANVAKLVTQARRTVAGVLKVKDDEIFFNSGGTEGDCHAILGSLGHRRDKEIVVSTIEHSAVHQTCLALEQAGVKVNWIRPDASGSVDVSSVVDAVNQNTQLVSIMHVNNETGAINDIAGIAKAVKLKNPQTIFHSDGVQAFLKLPINIAATSVDIYNFSGHKINGPKGVGATYIRKGTSIKPLLTGGSQESGVRAGTENVYSILGMAEAINENSQNILKRHDKIKDVREKLAQLITDSVTDVIINGQDVSPYVLSVSALGVRGETLVHTLENAGILVGTGSACTSNKKGVSRILTEMGIPDNLAEGTIRISFALNDEFNQFDRFAEEYKAAVNRLRLFRRR